MKRNIKRRIAREGSKCDHEWQTFKQSIKIDYSVKVLEGEYRHYSGPIGPYFIVKACPKCKTKHYEDMKYLDKEWR